MAILQALADEQDLLDPYASNTDGEMDGDDLDLLAASLRDRRPRKTARRATVLEWMAIGEYSTEAEKCVLLSLTQKQCRGDHSKAGFSAAAPQGARFGVGGLFSDPLKVSVGGGEPDGSPTPHVCEGGRASRPCGGDLWAR